VGALSIVLIPIFFTFVYFTKYGQHKVEDHWGKIFAVFVTSLLITAFMLVLVAFSLLFLMYQDERFRIMAWEVHKKWKVDKENWTQAEKRVLSYGCADGSAGLEAVLKVRFGVTKLIIVFEWAALIASGGIGLILFTMLKQYDVTLSRALTAA
jgi:hypothetical protein